MYLLRHPELVPLVKGTFKYTAVALILKRGTILIYLLLLLDGHVHMKLGNNASE